MAELGCGGILWVRRFVWLNPTGSPAMCCERLPRVAPHPRGTEAAHTTRVRWAWSGSASEVARRLRAEGLAVRRQTLHRWMQAVPLPEPRPPRVMGIEAWARRQGPTDATILVDHEQGALLEILPDTRPETVAAWLRAHPTVAILTRDRDPAFARGIADGAPQAEPGADRWHLLRNLATAMERFLQRHRECVLSTGNGSCPKLVLVEYWEKMDNGHEISPCEVAISCPVSLYSNARRCGCFRSAAIGPPSRFGRKPRPRRPAARRVANPAIA